MREYPHLIDNRRKSLGDVLNEVAINYKNLSIATGYWDIEGTLQIIESIKNYDSVRLLIGKEPLAHRLQQKFNIDPDSPQNIFPDTDIEHDLENYSDSFKINKLRETAKIISEMIKDGKLQVRIFRKPRLHAKAYIFGKDTDDTGVGILGSSNFTKAGLTSNAELNSLVDDTHLVLYAPKTKTQPHSYLSWFDEMWNDEEALEWTGQFSEIIAESPLGDLTYGPYDVYIKTLMELFPEELIEPCPFTKDVSDYLHPFQNQNALALRRKLFTNGVAMLSDSVGLGKTVTSAAVIDQYIKEEKDNIVLILPASLKQQWIDELASEPWDLAEYKDYNLVTQQNIRELNELKDIYVEKSAKQKDVDLFVIDEAHNLRNQNSERYRIILELLQANPNSHVLLLTATPVNNSLMDFAYQIQLASKGDLVSRNVRLKRRNSDTVLNVDFFEALRRIQSEATRYQKQGKEYDWNFHKSTLISGLRHYLVRSTRQGVIRRNAMKKVEEQEKIFPESKVKQIIYKYTDEQLEYINKIIEKNIESVFEGIDPRLINLDITSNITQINSHPLDLVKDIHEKQINAEYESISKQYNIDEDTSRENILTNNNKKFSVISIIFQIINLLGFSPYRLDLYENRYFNKSIEGIRSYGVESKQARKIQMQMTIHNMLQTTWLKRLESSTETLKKSMEYYLDRIYIVNKWLNEGYLVGVTDANILESEYGDSVEEAFEDYNEYLKEFALAIKTGKESSVEKRGIEYKPADSDKYNISQLHMDFKRDVKITNVLIELLSELSKPESNTKLIEFAKGLKKVVSGGEYGGKALIFSFFSDTINYLKDNLPKLLEDEIEDFNEKALFVTGQMGDPKKASRLFSPKSQKYKLKKDEIEVNYLFATDVLSEGQNLQDAAILVNYDLHWNPVRMIQRNGRINRLGSTFEEVLIVNSRPHDDLEMYLNLLKRLESKISAIGSTVGTDQSVLGERIKPREFTDRLEESYVEYSTDSFGIYDTDSDKATIAWQQIEGEKDLFDWSDKYSLELRSFIDANKDNLNEIERIKSIPIGKWNYLPESNKEYMVPGEIIGLYKTDGVYTATNEIVQDLSFVRINKSYEQRGPFSNIIAEYISEEFALERIKTEPTDNKRKFDLIEIDRTEYYQKGLIEVDYSSNRKKRYYEIKPAGDGALHLLNQHLNISDIQGVISSGITRSNEKKEFEKIVRLVNNEWKEFKQLNLSTLNRFQKLVSLLNEKTKKEYEQNEIKGVLFYASPE
ncbi:MAG: DEAD/DEAH box helicase family protein [Clostridiaceae bacterium]|nr:DEAD/DEAH box helicase family protein [Clostridiaceae bacterium]